jgi:hypothetical protein
MLTQWREWIFSPFRFGKTDLSSRNQLVSQPDGLLRRIEAPAIIESKIQNSQGASTLGFHVYETSISKPPVQSGQKRPRRLAHHLGWKF